MNKPAQTPKQQDPKPQPQPQPAWRPPPPRSIYHNPDEDSILSVDWENP